jgi:ribosomal protein S18 acetylase RimI-like enzyme
VLIDSGGNTVTLIRPLAETDSFEALTVLLNQAYAPLAAAGMRFVASYQNVKTTKMRCERGQTFVAEVNQALVGTITLYGPSESKCDWYTKPDVWHFGQFGVAIKHQKCGIGRALLSAVESAAIQFGARYLALDTSENAAELRGYYERLGYKFMEYVTWGDAVNYRSVVLSKELAQTRVNA